jgi:predicted nucleic acid-binding protein
MLTLLCCARSGGTSRREQKKIKLPDAIILVMAEGAKRQLVTRNVKDFPAGMRGVRVPYRI